MLRASSCVRDMMPLVFSITCWYTEGAWVPMTTWPWRQQVRESWLSRVIWSGFQMSLVVIQPIGRRWPTNKPIHNRSNLLPNSRAVKTTVRLQEVLVSLSMSKVTRPFRTPPQGQRHRWEELPTCLKYRYFVKTSFQIGIEVANAETAYKGDTSL